MVLDENALEAMLARQRAAEQGHRPVGAVRTEQNDEFEVYERPEAPPEKPGLSAPPPRPMAPPQPSAQDDFEELPGRAPTEAHIPPAFRHEPAPVAAPQGMPEAPPDPAPPRMSEPTPPQPVQPRTPEPEPVQPRMPEPERAPPHMPEPASSPAPQQPVQPRMPEPEPAPTRPEPVQPRMPEPAEQLMPQPEPVQPRMPEPAEPLMPQPVQPVPSPEPVAEPAEAPKRRPQVWPPISMRDAPAAQAAVPDAETPPVGEAPEPRTHAPTPHAFPTTGANGDGCRIAIVQALFNQELTDPMAAQAKAHAEQAGATVTHHLTVPGVYDLPLAVQSLARRKDVDAVVVIGVVVQGETKHDELITFSTAKSLQEVSLATETPVGLGIIGPGMTWEQAEARVGNGVHAVEAAMVQWRALQTL